MINLIIVLTILILISVFPIGYLLAYLCKDELIDGRKYFLLLVILSLIASLIIAFLDLKEKIVIILSLFYICIISLISIWKSYDRKFVK